jgi:hypothetical protein
LGDEEQDQKNRHEDAKRRLLTVPDLRLPHRKPFAAGALRRVPENDCAGLSGGASRLGERGRRGSLGENEGAGIGDALPPGGHVFSFAQAAV